MNEAKEIAEDFILAVLPFVAMGLFMFFTKLF